MEADLECPVCYELSRPPIYQCPEGHIICSGRDQALEFDWALLRYFQIDADKRLLKMLLTLMLMLMLLLILTLFQHF